MNQPPQTSIRHPTITWSLQLPDRLKSQDLFEHRHTTRAWRVRHAERLHFEATIHYALLQRGLKPPHDFPTTKHRITIARHLGPRERPYDPNAGLAGSGKQIIDAIKRLRWIRDDNPTHLETIWHEDHTRRDRPGCTITLENLNVPLGTPSFHELELAWQQHEIQRLTLENQALKAQNPTLSAPPTPK